MKYFVLVIALACCVGAATVAAQTLRQEADGAHVLLGCAVNAAYLGEAAYTTAVAREFNMLEPEDAMKWEVVHPEAHRFDFGPGDRIVSFAEAHAMKVRGHTLVWHKQLPPWLSDKGHAATDLFELLHEHIRQVVTHYRGRVFAWDVANEAFDENGRLRSTLWLDRPGIGLQERGTAYIEQAFRWAREADPDALLFYNDAEAEEVNVKSDAIYAMVRDFRSRGVPIDGVGMQMHVTVNGVNVKSIRENLERFTALGVQVHITEMDVALQVAASGAASASDLERQAQVYEEITQACLAFKGCTALEAWGVTDKYSWIGHHSAGKQGAALLLDRSYHAKPAYYAVGRALAKARRARTLP